MVDQRKERKRKGECRREDFFPAEVAEALQTELDVSVALKRVVRLHLPFSVSRESRTDWSKLRVLVLVGGFGWQEVSFPSQSSEI